jgi:toxin ParE1/3/4
VSNVRFRPQAINDLRDILDFTWEHFGQDRAEKYVRMLHATCVDLAAGTRTGRPAVYKPDDFLMYHVESHVVFYKEVNPGIEVIRIFHERMDPSRHL